ncbi:MAG: hypothetical protein ACOX9C_12870 [Kiritimatiellia bacterium]|jgi:hypothetical protein
MAKDKRQAAIKRQKKIAKQKAKKKEMIRRQRANPQGVSFEGRFGTTRQEVREGEADRAWIPGDMFGRGIGPVIVTRRLPDGAIAAGVFLVDAWCCGVKDAFFKVFDEEGFEDFLEGLSGGVAYESAAPERAAKLIADAVDYAGRLGLDPHRDYADASLVLHGIDIARCDEAFEFGRNGRPCYNPGPNETDERIEHVLQCLAKNCGAGNFTFVGALYASDQAEFDSAEGATGAVACGEGKPRGRPRKGDSARDAGDAET